MKLRFLILLFSVVILNSCKKEVFVPVDGCYDSMDTRGSIRNPEDNGDNNDDNDGITDPDNEGEEDKVKNKKKKAR